MSNIFKICCLKDPRGSIEGIKENFGKMDQVNGHYVPATCPFSGESVEKNDQKSAKPNLRIKVPQPLRLKNHLESEENLDTLHSRMGEVTSFVSTYFFVYTDYKT